MKEQFFTASDYAGLAGGDHEFYYGYESAPRSSEGEEGPWLFVAKHKGVVVMQYSAKDLGMEKRAFECAEVLLAGIARYFALAKP